MRCLPTSPHYHSLVLGLGSPQLLYHLGSLLTPGHSGGTTNVLQDHQGQGAGIPCHSSINTDRRGEPGMKREECVKMEVDMMVVAV